MPVEVDFTPEFSWLDWGGDISVVAGVFFIEALYLLSVGPLRTRFPGSSDVPTRRIVLFTVGLWSIFFALYSPLDPLSDYYLFSAHMIQHLLLVLVGPPLMLLGTPGWMLRPILQLPGIFGIARVLTFPVLAALLFNVVFAIWHVPAIYEAGLKNITVHIIQHITFIATGVIMWWPVLSPMKELPRLPYGAQVLYMFILSVPPAIVGALITFADGILYQTYANAPEIWGISTQADQQIGGVIMKLPGFLIFVTAAGIIFFNWAAKEEEKDRLEVARRMKEMG